MAETAPQGRPAFLKLLQSVNVLETLQSTGMLPTLRDTQFGEIPPIIFRCWSEATGAFEEAAWVPKEDGSGPYPFYTLDDLKLAIYKNQNSDPKWIPTQIFVGTSIGDMPNPAEFRPLDTIWMDGKEEIILPTPLNICKPGARPLGRFVEATGQAKLVERQDRGRTTLEDAYIIPRGGEMPVFYAFCVSDMLRRFGVGAQGQPVPAYDWNGRFRPYFPALSATSYEPAGIAQVEKQVDYKRRIRALLRGINQALAADQPLVAIEVSGIYALRLLLNVEPVDGFAGCEEFFFRTSVNSNRPFMRLLPSEGTPITKINVVGVTSIPDIKDPNLIVQWAQEYNPYEGEDQDYLFVKLYIRDPVRESIFPLYATARMFHDGTADMIVLPSKQQRILNPRLDLAELDTRTSKCLSGTFIEGSVPQIAEVSLQLALNLSRDDVPLTRARIIERLRIFSYFFQESPNFDKEDVPLIMLKYKAVSQYATEPRIFAYISQYFLKVQRGEARISEQLIHNISEEFQLTTDEAQDYARRFAIERDSFVAMAPEIRTFSEENATGIDIGIYGKHPTYEVRVYRCKSETTLRRIYLLLTLLLSREAEIPTDQFSPDEMVAAAEAAEEAVMSAEQQEDEAEETAGAVSADETSPLSQASLPAPATAKKSALMAAMMNSDSESESPEPVRPPPTAKKSALMAAMMNSDSESEEEEAPVQLPPKKSALLAAMAQSDSDEEEVAATTVAAPPPPPTLTVKRAEPPQPPKEEGENWNQKLRGYFAKQLAKIDPALFVYKPVVGDPYTRRCQASNNQQPLVLTPVEYNRMKEEYKDDTDKVQFIDFPLVGEDYPKVRGPPIEVITVMRYGSDPNNLNYYLCAKYFCHLDRIIILKEEFENAGEWRNPDKTGVKPANRCPFCGGSEIKDPTKTGPGQTVSVRKDKPKTNEIQDYIDFLKPTNHPKGLELPCCYISPRPTDLIEKSKKLHISKPAFTHMRSLEQVAEAPPTTGQDDVIEQYSIALSKFPQKYILTENHHPLATSKFGLVASCVDKYFEQESDSLVSRTAIRQVVRPNIKGFFRMGVNMVGGKRDTSEGLFNVLAPYLNVNTADDVRNLFLNSLGDNNIENKNKFLAANHGNLVNDFYKPSIAQDRPSEKDLADFSRDLATTYNSAISKADMERLYMSYNLFINYLRDPSQVKEYRIFAPLLAYPGMITSRGLVIILLEYDTRDFAAPVKVRCPPFGYQPNIYDFADFAFILRDQNGVYEALPYIERMGDRHSSYLSFQVAQIPQVADIIGRRRKEFAERCKAPQYNIYTGQSGVPNSSILSYSQVLSAEFQGATRGLATPLAIVRDAYNHISGCTFAYKYWNNEYEIPFPIADHDGFIPFKRQFHFDWSAIPEKSLPTVPALLKFYNEVLAAVDSCKGYEPVEAKQYRDKIVAVKLKNGLLVPVNDSSKTSPIPIDPNNTEFEPEWEINRCMVLNDCKKGQLPKDAAPLELDKDKLDELYQHFRLSVANWLNSDEVDGDFVKQLESGIIFNHKLPLYERRKRLEYKLRELYDWFVQDNEFVDEEPTFYRRDCRKIKNPGSCTGACKWKQTGAASGTCAIHISTTYAMGDESQVDTATVFVRRVVDELLIFPEKRRQIIQQSVKKTGALKIAVKIKGEVEGSMQFIIPDNSPRWQELLSLLWSTDIREEQQAMEEISGDATEEEAPACATAIPRSAAAAPRPTIRRAPVAAATEEPAVQPLGPLVPPAQLKRKIVRDGAGAPLPALTIRRAAAAPKIRRAAPTGEDA